MSDYNHIVEKRVPCLAAIIGSLILALPVVAARGVCAWAREKLAG